MIDDSAPPATATAMSVTNIRPFSRPLVAPVHTAAPAQPQRPTLILCTATQCESASDPELNAVVGAAELASALGLTFVVLDASPVAAVAEALSNARATVISAAPADACETFRAALCAAAAMTAGDGVVAWLEPTQRDLVRFVPRLAAMIREGHADAVLPRRPAGPGAGYSAAQRHAEAFGNLYLDAELDALRRGAGAPPAPPLDWFFGALLLRASLVRLWAEHDAHGPARAAAMLLPLVRALRDGATLAAPAVAYVHAAEQLPRASSGANATSWPPAPPGASQTTGPSEAPAAAAANANANANGSSLPARLVGAGGGPPQAPPDAPSAVGHEWSRLSATLTAVAEALRAVATADDDRGVGGLGRPVLTEVADPAAAAAAEPSTPSDGVPQPSGGGGGAGRDLKLSSLLPHIFGGAAAAAASAAGGANAVAPSPPPVVGTPTTAPQPTTTWAPAPPPAATQPWAPAPPPPTTAAWAPPAPPGLANNAPATTWAPAPPPGLQTK